MSRSNSNHGSINETPDNITKDASNKCAVNAPKAPLLLFYGESITAKDQTNKMSKKKGLALFINDHLCGEYLLIKLENSAPFEIKLTQRTIFVQILVATR